jgi:hypothetical protein
MKAMLDPKIVTAKIQGWARGVHGAAAGLANITASSHGCLNICVMFLIDYHSFALAG